MRDGLHSIPFQLLDQQCNDYIFSDQVVVKVKLILISISRQSEFAPLVFDIRTETSVAAPDYLRGTPGEFEQGNCRNGEPRWECPILARVERWNLYSAEDEEARDLKVIFRAAKSFKLTNAFDKDGQPIYEIQGKAVIKFDDRLSQNLRMSRSRGERSLHLDSF